MAAADYFAQRDRRRRRAFVAERLWWIAVSLFLLAVIFVGVVTAAAVSQATCEACHGRAAVALAASPHSTVRCDRCHAGTGVAGLIDNRIRVVGMVVRAPLSWDETASTYVANEVCDGCHASGTAATLVSKGLRMSHREVVAAGWSCMRCHASDAHGQPGSTRGRYTMGMCLDCHRVDPLRPEGCGKCHTDDDTAERRDRSVTPWGVTHGPSWRSTHGMGDLSTCKACHVPAYCVECHGMVVPHPIDFAKRHGKATLAREDGDDACLVCHKADACMSCHGMLMPHAAGFLQGHSVTVAASGSRVCERCHEPASCLECHSRHAHPGLSPERIEQLRRRPVTR